MSNQTEFPTIKWQRLKEFCNSLTEEQLQQEVKCFNSDNETPIEIFDASELGEVYYTFPDFEYGCTEKDFDKDIMTDDDCKPLYQSIEEAIAVEEHYITPADRVYLYAE